MDENSGDSHPKCVRVRFTGRVQGVGFRMTTQSIAGRFDVVGNVRNLGDGGVALVAEGSTHELQQFIQAICTRFERNIVSMDSQWEDVPERSFSDFSIAETTWS